MIFLVILGLAYFFLNPPRMCNKGGFKKKNSFMQLRHLTPWRTNGTRPHEIFRNESQQQPHLKLTKGSMAWIYPPTQQKSTPSTPRFCYMFGDSDPKLTFICYEG